MVLPSFFASTSDVTLQPSGTLMVLKESAVMTLWNAAFCAASSCALMGPAVIAFVTASSSAAASAISARIRYAGSCFRVVLVSLMVYCLLLRTMKK